MLKNFRELLKERGIKQIRKEQLLSLYLHPNIGYDIDNWKSENVIKLLSVSFN